ncbi:hypothetical protein ARMGADRAFT_1158460 [Armillaria gallica]|uniref:Uncharacterized protein n=1 Tax=Armillaria gallica TaxID=47427 RepID=A0A2H3EPP3_ARMGA|nr:hypothetical protein ARMGADRAFT_1158460 [Armillaria gallica]
MEPVYHQPSPTEQPFVRLSVDKPTRIRAPKSASGDPLNVVHTLRVASPSLQRRPPSLMHVLSNNRHDPHLPPARPISPSRSKLIIARPSISSVLCIQWTAYLKLDVTYGLAVGCMDYANSKEGKYPMLASSASTSVKLASSLTLAPASELSTYELAVEGMDYREEGKKQTVRMAQVFTISVHVPLEPQVRHLSIIRRENTIHSLVAYSGRSTFGVRGGHPFQGSFNRNPPVEDERKVNQGKHLKLSTYPACTNSSRDDVLR